MQQSGKRICLSISIALRVSLSTPFHSAPLSRIGKKCFTQIPEEPVSWTPEDWGEPNG